MDRTSVEIWPPLYDPRFFLVFSVLNALPRVFFKIKAAFLPHPSSYPSYLREKYGNKN